jgi:hypothetical protein
VVAIAAFFCVVPAVSPEADTKHAFSGSFGSAGSGAEQLSLVAANFETTPQVGGSGVAVDQASGDVYVADTANFRVDQFSSSGGFVRAWGWGVADGMAAFETCTIVCQVGVSGAGAGQFTAPTFIAVDNSSGLSAGDVYVGDTATKVVQKFTATGVLVGGWGAGGQLRGVSGERPFGPLAGIAVDAAGTLDVLDTTSEVLFRFAQDGSFKDELPVVRGTLPGGLAVDSKGDFFKVNGDVSVEEFGPSGGVIGQVTPTETAASGASIAIDPSNGDLYLDYSAKAVERFAFDEFGRVVEPGGAACAKFEEGCAPSETFGSGSLNVAAGVSVRGSDHTVYVGDASPSAVKSFAFLTVPGVSTASATSVGLGAATLNGTVNPEGIEVTECEFLYGETEAYGHTAPCTPSGLGTGVAPVPVHAVIEGLSPNTTYHFRLVVANKNGGNQGADGSFITPSPPLIVSASTANVTADSADLLGAINPVRAQTTYRFEYGTTSSYGKSIPTADVSVGADETEHEVTQHIQGLQAGTVYHYRVVAHNAFGTTTSPDHTFTTQTITGDVGLPDGRGYELVSPLDKGASILPSGHGALAVGEASVAGSAVTYAANGPTESNPQGNSNNSQVLSVRGPNGWSSQDIATPHDVATGVGGCAAGGYILFSDDLSFAGLTPCGAFAPSLSDMASEQTSYLRTDFFGGDVGRPCSSSCYAPLVTGCPPVGHQCASSVEEHADVPPGTVFGAGAPPIVRGATPDMSRVILESRKVALGADPVPAGLDGLYEWTAGRLTFIGVGSPNNAQARTLFQGVSSDGSRVVFNGVVGGLEELFVRDVVRGVTVRVDGVESGCGGCVVGGSVFQGVSSDGSRVFFTSEGRLTKGSGASEKHPDLYVCDLVVVGGGVGCRLSDLTPGGDVSGRVLGLSKDGSWVYFAANGVLAGGAVQGDCLSSASSARCNVYVLRSDGVVWGAPRLVAVVSGADHPDWGGQFEQHTSRVSSGGGWLAFQSEVSLTGYDNRDAVSGRLDEEVYLYNGVSGVLVCASCNPTGARPFGVKASTIEEGIAIPRQTWGAQWLGATVPVWNLYEEGLSVYQPRYLSDSGRVFFDSSDGLVPRAVNRMESVYEYEPVGVGGCSSGVAGQGVVFFGGGAGSFNGAGGGCVGLLSSGGVSGESAFYDASESGGDVFLLTSAKLVGADRDTNLDVYDAHECTIGSPCLPEPSVVPPACDTGDSCKPSPSPQPLIFGAPASSTFSGTGNPVSNVPAVRKVVLTRAQKLARALSECRRKAGKRRVVCERQARRAYGPVHKARHGVRRSGKRGGGR